MKRRKSADYYSVALSTQAFMFQDWQGPSLMFSQPLEELPIWEIQSAKPEADVVWVLNLSSDLKGYIVWVVLLQNVAFLLLQTLRSMPMKCEAQPRLSEKVKRVLNNPASFWGWQPSTNAETWNPDMQSLGTYSPSTGRYF